MLSIQPTCVFAAAVMKFSPLLESDRTKKVEKGDIIVLYCEVSHPSAQVCWFKDGEELQLSDALNIQSDGIMRRIVIQSAEKHHTGVYTCQTSGDMITFMVEVAGKVPEQILYLYNTLYYVCMLEIHSNVPSLSLLLSRRCIQILKKGQIKVHL